MSRTTRSVLEALPEELLVEITRYAAEGASEHEYHATDGQYCPREFDSLLFDVNHTTRNRIQNSMENDFAFIEVYYHGCRIHDRWRRLVRNFETTFQYARNDRLLLLRRNNQVRLSTLRIDMRCPLACQHAAGPEQLLVFTEATLFASILICNMIQYLLPDDSRLEVNLTSRLRHTTDLLHKTLVCMCRYIRNAMVTRVTGLAANRAQTLTNILGIQLAGMTTGDLACMHKEHVRDMQTLLSAETPVHALVPAAFWFHIAFQEVMSELDEPDRDDKMAHDIWCYLVDLDDNNTDMMLRGIANHLLMRPASNSHFFTAANFSSLPILDLLSAMVGSLKASERDLEQLQLAAGRPYPHLTFLDLKKRYKIEEMYKTFAHLALGIARMITLPLAELPHWSHNFANMLTVAPGNFESLLGYSYRSIVRVNHLVLKPFYHWSGTQYYPDESSDLTEKEAGIYYATRMWQQHIALLFHAVRRADSADPQVRLRGLEMLRRPVLYDVALWRPIQDLAPNEPDRVENHFITHDKFPALVRNHFHDALQSVMTEYTMPFYSEPETLEAVHKELQEAGHF